MLNNLLHEDLICLDLQSNTKEEVLDELAQLLYVKGYISDKDLFLKHVWEREALGSTGFEDGIAIPHAKSNAVLKPAVVVGLHKSGLDFDADDNQNSNTFFMLASPADGDNHHIEALAQVSTLILTDGFIQKLHQAKTKNELMQFMLPHPPADELKTDTQPQQAHQNQPQQNQPESSWKDKLTIFKQHLLFGTSHMIPFIVAGGVLLSLAVMISGEGAVPESGVLKDIASMGIAGLTLFTAVLGGYIAYSIADKPGLAPGMIGSWIAVQQYSTGFLGAIVVGFIAGFIVKMLKKIKFPDSMASLGSIFIYPLIGTFLTCSIVMWGIGEPIAAMMEALNNWLASMAGSGKALLGAILGGMTAFDMGGPINKVATLFAQTQVDTQPWLMGGVGIAICVPPLGMALATLLSPKRYKRDEREAGKAAAIMGMIGISEGAIPFAASDPIRVIPAIVAGGIVGNVIGFMMNVINHAPWGGWIVLPVVDGKIGYIVGTIAGALTTAIIVNLLKKPVTEEDETEFQSEQTTETIQVGEGEAEVIAVTACPSGVAHTFMAAKSLEKAGHRLGIKVKVETQGANGIVNRITPLDIKNAKLVILAHDVAIKEAERFQGIQIIDTTTKDAMTQAEKLIQTQTMASPLTQKATN